MIKNNLLRIKMDKKKHLDCCRRQIQVPLIATAVPRHIETKTKQILCTIIYSWIESMSEVDKVRFSRWSRRMLNMKQQLHDIVWSQSETLKWHWTLLFFWQKKNPKRKKNMHTHITAITITNILLNIEVNEMVFRLEQKTIRKKCLNHLLLMWLAML